MQEVPQIQLLVIQSQGIKVERSTTFQFRNGPVADLEATADSPFGECGEDALAQYTKDGRFVAIATDEAVNIYTSEEQKIVQTIPQESVLNMTFSPLGSFLVTFKHKVKGVANVMVWDVKTGQEVLSFSLQEFESWPLQWSDNEEVLCHMVPNHVNFMDGKAPSTRIGKLAVKGVNVFSIAGSGKHICVFVPEKSQPACASIYSIEQSEEKGGELVLSADPVASKIFYRAKDANLQWSPLGNGVLVTGSTEEDKTDSNYYGESQLHLLLTDGQTFAVQGGAKGAIHDVKWSPQGTDFIVIQGDMPAKITLFAAATCQPVRDFGNHTRNTIIFSPHGRFVVFGGFGNISTGEMDFWEKNKFKCLGTAKDDHMPGKFEWTPDSRNFITATIFPRRRVDEGFKVWTYYGEKMYEIKIDKLTQVAIRPGLPDVYPNRPISPRLKDRRIQQEIANKMEAAKPKAYVPPHLRGRGGAQAPSNIVKASRDVSGPRKLVNTVQTEEQQAAALASKSDKNKKRRERAKQKKDEEEKKEKDEEMEKKNKQQQEQQAKLEGMSEKEVAEKKLKKLTKLLRQVEKLREQQASGAQMDKSQLEKLKANENIESEMNELLELIKS